MMLYENPEEYQQVFFRDMSLNYRNITGLTLETVIQKYIKQYGNDVDMLEFSRTFPYISEISKSEVQDFVLRHGRMPKEAELFIFYSEMMYWYSYKWVAYGKRDFRIATELVKLMNDTDLKVPDMYLRPPFETMYMGFEGDVVQMLASKGTTFLDGAIIVNDIPVMLSKTETVQGARVMFFSRHSQMEERMGIAAGRKIPMAVVGRTLDEMAIPHVLGSTNEMVTPETIRKWVQRAMFDFSDQHLQQYVDLFSLVCNTLAYINSGGADLLTYEPPDIEVLRREAVQLTGREGRKAKEKLKRAEARTYILVGSRIPPTPAQPTVLTTKGTRKLTYRHMVRGHWRAYWKKEDRLTKEERGRITYRRPDGLVRVLKWVKPFLRGPEAAEVIARRYRVGRPEPPEPPEEGWQSIRENPFAMSETDFWEDWQ